MLLRRAAELCAGCAQSCTPGKVHAAADVVGGTHDMWDPRHAPASFLRGPRDELLSGPGWLPSAGGRPAPWGSQTAACAMVCSWQQLPDAALAPLLPAAAAAGGCAQPGIFSCPRPWAQLGGSYAPSSRVTYIVNCSILPGNFQWSCGNLDYQSDLGRLKPRSCGLHSPSSPSLRPTGNWEPGSSSLTSLGQLGKTLDIWKL